jgi:type I restriction enzyme M protein
VAVKYEDFEDAFLTALSQDNFYQGQSLLQYLAKPEDERGNDEADIVDNKITSELIKALGYASGEITYNRSKGIQRPDFIVTISAYPRPCFIAESKNTATKKLEAHLPQLESYMRSQGAPRGLLIDGKRLLAYDLADPSPVTTSDISLFNIVQAWRGEGIHTGKQGRDALLPDDRLQLRAFFARFNREAYAGSTKLIEDLIYIRGKDELHAINGSTWPSQSRIPIKKANDDIEGLIENTRDLISEIQLDVEAQLKVRLDEYETFEEEREFLPGRTKTVKEAFNEDLKKLSEELRRAGFTPPMLESVQFHLESQLERLTERNLANSYGNRLKEQLNTLRKQQFEAGNVLVDDGSEALDLGLTSPNPQATLLKAPKAKKRTFQPMDALPEAIAAPLRRLQNVLGDYHENRETLNRRFAPALEVKESFETWREKVATLLLRTADPARLRKEFAAQTAYVMIVRMLVVRIAEDKKLLERVFTNGGLSLWFSQVEPRYLKFAQGKGTDYLLEMAYTSAQHIYAHFYAERLLFDWYRPDRNLVVRVLHRLAGYDLSTIDDDVIGHVYSGYVQDEHKHESGMYYTPPEVVEYILDRLGYTGTDIIGKKILDPASGSGTFLVSATRRLVKAYQDYYKNEPPVEEIQTIISDVTNSVYGLDLNPFACYLAETNLLIQLLDLIKRALDNGQAVNVGRFNIYNTDTLRYSPKTLGVTKGTLEFPADELPVQEQIKAKVGEFKEGFDFVVANPPYVRADEGGDDLLIYRAAIKEEHPFTEVRETLVKKWDLLVPFVALGWYLLKDDGRMGMITSDAIESRPYAEPLRELLVKQAKVNEIAYFPNVKLFEDAVVTNTIFHVGKNMPSATHETRRVWFNTLTFTPTREEKLNQATFATKVFHQATVTVSISNSVPLGDICFISAGMELQAHEDKFANEFQKDNLISNHKDAKHPVAYVENSDTLPFEITQIRYLEYGTGLRAPERVRRSRFEELFRLPKLGTPMVVSADDKYQGQAFLDDGSYPDGGCSPIIVFISLCLGIKYQVFKIKA